MAVYLGSNQVEINMGSSSSGAVIEPLTVTTNGTYTASGIDGYSPVTVNVSGTSPTLISKTITQNGTYNASSDNADGYSSVVANISPNLTTKSITQNGTYNASSDSVDGYSSVTVNVSGGSGSDGELKVITSSTQQIDSTGSTLTFSGLSSAPTSFFVKLYPSPPTDLYIMQGSSEAIYVTGVTGFATTTGILLDCLQNNIIYSQINSSASASYEDGVLNIHIPLVDDSNSSLYFGVAYSDISGQDIESSFVLYYI